MQQLQCRYSGRCSGCAWITLDRSSQRSQKLDSIRNLADPEFVRWIECGHGGLRDRVDLTWDHGRLGLYEQGAQREILDLEECPMLSESLAAWFLIYRSRKPPIVRGSVRLRVSPEGERGVWLDFANADVKALFEERDYLRWLSEHAIVEIGQRKKRLEWMDGAPKLRDPKLHAWFETYGRGGERIPVYGAIASFTQSGFAPNRALVGEVLKQAFATGETEWLELFAGSGNFSLALAHSGSRVRAVEMDSLAVESLLLGAERSGLKLEAVRQDLYRSAPEDLSPGGWLVDPPRSGLKMLVDKIAEVRPKHLVYISCWSESLLADAEKLRSIGYLIKSVSAVDQFVHSPHVEWVVTFQRK